MADFDYDVVVVGSGFGGSVTALRLTEKGYRVGVIEAGRRFTEEDLPRTSWDLRRFLWAPALGLRGIQRITPLRDLAILSGAGVGGGSLVYANTLYEPLAPFYTDPAMGPHHRLAGRAGAVLRPGQADAGRERGPRGHAARRVHAPVGRRPRRVGHVPPDPGRCLVRRGRHARARPVLRRRRDPTRSAAPAAARA